MANGIETLEPISPANLQLRGQRLDGKRVSQHVLEQLSPRIERLKTHHQITPKLVVVRVGEDPASVVYVNKKAKTAQKLGLLSDVHVFPETTPEAELLNHLQELNDDPKIHGILVQLPLPTHISTDKVLHRVAPHKDVDGFHPMNLGELFSGNVPVAPPCTPAGMMAILDAYQIPVEGANAVVLGRSKIVGRPVGMMLLERNATVTYCHSKTRNLAEVVANADILVAAVGRGEMVRGSWLKHGAVVLDVGINRVEDKLVGDVAFEEALPVVSYITPVPGGVGPMTIAMLMQNTVSLCEQSLGR